MRFEIVKAELDVGDLHRNVRATLDIGRTPVRVIDRLTVHGDAHQIQPKRVLRSQLSRNACYVDSFVIIEQSQIIVDHLDGHVRSFALNEAGVYDIVGMQVSASLIFHLCRGKLKLLAQSIHGSARTSAGKTDVVRVHHGGAAIQAFIASVANEAQPRIGLVGNIR